MHYNACTKAYSKKHHIQVSSVVIVLSMICLVSLSFLKHIFHRLYRNMLIQNSPLMLILSYSLFPAALLNVSFTGSTFLSAINFIRLYAYSPHIPVNQNFPSIDNSLQPTAFIYLFRESFCPELHRF